MQQQQQMEKTDNEVTQTFTSPKRWGDCRCRYHLILFGMGLFGNANKWGPKIPSTTFR